MDKEKINPLNIMVILVVVIPIAYEIIELLFGRFWSGIAIIMVTVVSGFMLVYERYFNK